MAKDRNLDTPIIDNNHYGTWSIPSLNPIGMGNSRIFDDVRYKEHVYIIGERLDQLAYRYFNESEYWWIIALYNNIYYPFKSGGLTAGKILKIPLDVNDILDKIFKK